MNYFFDNNLSPRIARALHELEGDSGDKVVHLKEKFAQDITDEDWIRALGAEGNWAVITCDKRISKNPHELKAWKESGLIVFFLKGSWLNISFWDQSWQLVKKWQEIKKHINKARPGDSFIVPITGHIE